MVVIVSGKRGLSLQLQFQSEALWRREHWNGDLQVEEEPAKDSLKKGIPGRKKSKG